MRIRLKPEQLLRRVQLACLKARASYQREYLIWKARHRRNQRLDSEERERNCGNMWAPYPMRALMDLDFMPFDCSQGLSKYKQICAEASGWVELNHEELEEIERWRKAPFARHPSNAETFPEIFGNA